MDKKSLKKKIKTGLSFSIRVLAGVFSLFLGAYIAISLAKNGSDIFYYALAFASPGNAIEFLSTPKTEGFFEETPTAEVFVPEETEKIEPVFENFSAPEIVFNIPEENRGKITETTYSASEGGIYIGYNGAIIKNCTKLSAKKVKEILSKNHSLRLDFNESAPQVLIYHTHATESYEPFDRDYFDKTGGWRSTDPDINMISVGDVITSVLTKKGIGVIHSGKMHDDPGYNGSYKRSAATVSEILEENPGIKICLDIHRDAIEPSESEIIKPVAVIDGKKAAQIMIIAGCDDGTMDMPDYAENLRFAAALSAKIEELYPGLCRPILFDYRKYNMDLSPGLLLIEIGASGNTFEEAKYSAELLANAIAELFYE